MSEGYDDYEYDYGYEASFDDDAMIDVKRLDIEYVDQLALANDQLHPDVELDLDDREGHGSRSHRHRRPHVR